MPTIKSGVQYSGKWTKSQQMQAVAAGTWTGFTSVEYLSVAGGGGGGYRRGGGGGAGGYLTGTETIKGTLTVTVGAGGGGEEQGT